MDLILSLLFIALLSLGFAWKSMRDFHLPEEIAKLISLKRMKGSIIFFKDKVTHYSSSSSSSSSSTMCSKSRPS